MPEKVWKEIPIVDASRAFPFAFRTPESILKSLDNYLQHPNGGIPIIEVFLAHKTKESKYSSNHLAPIGGKMLPGESVIQTAYRRIHEESTLVCSPLKEKEDSRFVVDGSFNYDVTGKDEKNPYEKRRVSFTVVPVVNPQIMTSIYPIQEDSKIDGFYGLSIEELNLAFNSGHHTDSISNETFPLQGHITKLKDAPDMTDSKSNRIERRKMLGEVTRILRQQEQRARSILYDNLVLLALGKMGFAEENLPIPGAELTKNVTPDEQFQRMKLKSEKLEELMVILKNSLGENFKEFFTEAYSKVLGQVYMTHFRENEEKHYTLAAKEKKRLSERLLAFLKIKKEKPIYGVLFNEAEVIRERMVNGNFSTDVLHFLPLFINMKDSFKGRTTRLIIELARFMRDLTKEAIIGGPYKSLDELREFFVDDNILLDTKLFYSQRFNKRLVEIISKVFNTDKKAVEDAWTLASRFIPELAEETKNADPKLSKLYQFHELRNEVTNLSLGNTLLLALGVDIKDNGTDWPIVKFEALRQLTFFLKILLEKPIYENIIKKKPHPIDFSINKFFGPVVDNRVIILNHNGEQRKMPITYRRGLDGNEFIVDEKPLKSLRSAVRKSLEENIEGIADIQSCAVVLPNELYDHLNSEQRIGFINQQAESFLEFLNVNYPSWDIVKMEDKNTFDNFEAAIKNEQVSETGKRTGSKGDLLIRRKIKLRMTDRKTRESYNYELVFYPFEEFDGENYYEKEEEKSQSKGLMGWREKMEDDPAYSLRRLIFPLRGALGLKSIYELLFPPSLYPELVKEMRESNINVYRHISS
ncbi:hypothetical protein HZA76_03645 [Candidatus Roizmanbacteria bacterium]|nr:hypothetical protein [Candidatus Roizmanbacteria bacterium]